MANVVQQQNSNDVTANDPLGLSAAMAAIQAGAHAAPVPGASPVPVVGQQATPTGGGQVAPQAAHSGGMPPGYLPPPNPSNPASSQRPAFVPVENAFGKNAQHRAGMNSFISNLTNTVNQAIGASKEKQIREATVTWNRLNTALQSGDQATVTDILGDKKIMTQMAKALNYDYLNPSKGSDNVYRRALNALLAQKQSGPPTAQQPNGAGANVPNIDALRAAVARGMSPQQAAQAAMLQSRLGKQPPSMELLKQQALGTLMNDPRGISEAMDDPKNARIMEALGLGPSANEQLRAEVEQQKNALTKEIADQKNELAKNKLDLQSSEATNNNMLKLMKMQQGAAQFGALQNRLNQQFTKTYALKQAALAQELKKTAVAAERNNIVQQQADNAKTKNLLDAYNTQLTTLTQQKAQRVAQLRSIYTNLRSQSGSLETFVYGKSNSLTKQGQQAIDDINKQIDAVNQQLVAVTTSKEKLIAQMGGAKNSLGVAGDDSSLKLPDDLGALLGGNGGGQ